MDIEYRALRAVSRRKHLRCVSMMVDAANQDKWDVPHLFPETHGSDRGWSEKQKLMACYVEGILLDIYQVPQTLGTGDSRRWQEIIEGQNGDIVLLGVSGKLPFDLPRDFPPLGDDNLSESGGGGENNIPEKSHAPQPHKICRTETSLPRHKKRRLHGKFKSVLDGP
ncbi:unnamed protein product [Pylaiella littoralis]